MHKLSKKDITQLLKPRKASSHKGTYGHGLLIAGSLGKMGAAVIAAKACMRSGIGLLTVNVPEEERFILQTAIPEAMLMLREEVKLSFNNFSAIAIGPGLGTNDKAKKILQKVLQAKKPLVLDADALNIISINKKLLQAIPPNSILTPHPKEFDRLFGNHNSNEERIKTAIAKAKQLNLIIVLKGHQTLITYAGKSFYNTTGNAGLAKGGSGDALTGIITAFLAQGYEPPNAAILAVYMHGLASDITLQTQSMESMLISDVIENIGAAFKSLAK